ncbi:MAG: hypothetical protein R3F43_05995 [bacterium]
MRIHPAPLALLLGASIADPSPPTQRPLPGGPGRDDQAAPPPRRPPGPASPPRSALASRPRSRWRRADGGQEAQQIRNHARSRSAFAHGELIGVPADQVRCEGRVCVALAVLDRARADDVLAVAYAEAAGRFRRACEPKQPSIVAYTRHLREADQAWRPSRPSPGSARSSGARPRGRWSTTARGAPPSRPVATDAWALLRLTVLAGRLASDAVGEAARDALVGALTQAGLAARKADSCVPTASVVPAGAVARDTGSFDPRCTSRSPPSCSALPGGPPSPPSICAAPCSPASAPTPRTTPAAASRRGSPLIDLAAAVVAAVHPAPAALTALLAIAGRAARARPDADRWIPPSSWARPSPGSRAGRWTIRS